MPRKVPRLRTRALAPMPPQLDIYMAIAGPYGDAALALCEETIAAFAALGHAGGYAVDSTPLASLQLVGGPYAGRPQFRLNAAPFDPRALQFLRNMALQLQKEGVVIEEVVVSAADEQDQAWTVVAELDDDNEDDLYPQPPADPGFEVCYEDVGASPLRRCVVEQAEPVTVAHVEAMIAQVEPWFEMIDRGAFSLPTFSPLEFDSMRGSVEQFEEDSIEISIFRHRGSEVVWSVLLNLLMRYSSASSGVRSVAIE